MQAMNQISRMPPYPSTSPFDLKNSIYSTKNRTCSNVSIALMLLLLRKTAMTRSTICIVSLRTGGAFPSRCANIPNAFPIPAVTVLLPRTSVSIHPHKPRHRVQHAAITPARPTPPRQCTRTCLPCRVYRSITRQSCRSVCTTEMGARPSGIGMRRTSNPCLFAVAAYSSQGTPKSASSSSSRQQTMHRTPVSHILRRSVARSR